MKTSVGKFDPESRTVAVTFTHNKVRHRRLINAALDAEGNYDRKATRELIDAQARGVEYKIERGIIE